MTNKVIMAKLPKCILCEMAGKDVPAKYDCRTKAGSWAYLCESCFKGFGVGLGTGFGQELILKDEE